LSVKRAHPLGKILFQEYPGAAWLGAGQQAQLGAPSHFLLVHVQEGSGFRQGEGSHRCSSDPWLCSWAVARARTIQRPR